MLVLAVYILARGKMMLGAVCFFVLFCCLISFVYFFVCIPFSVPSFLLDVFSRVEIIKGFLYNRIALLPFFVPTRFGVGIF